MSTKIAYSKMLTINGKQIFKTNPVVTTTGNNVKKIDRDWLKSTFMVGDKDLSVTDAKNRYFSTADLKFTDTTMGGNIGINSKPQFTRYADTRKKGRRADRQRTTINSNGSLGMGRFYSEVFDDNSLSLYLELGKPKFNSMLTFFTRSIDYKTSVIANTGRSPIAYNIGKLVGSAAVFLAYPAVTLAIWSIKAISDVVLGSNAFNYYYINPTMHVYWSTVNTILTNMITELGILIPEFMPDKNKQRIGVPIKLNKNDMAEMHRLLPDIIGNDNYVDIFAIANRAQLLANKQVLLERSNYENHINNDKNALGYLTAETNTVSKPTGGTLSDLLNNVLSVSDIYDYINPSEKKELDKTETTNATSTTKDKRGLESKEDGSYDLTEDEKKNEYLSALGKYFDAAVRDGGGHAIFKVDYAGSVSDSFSNSITEIPSASGLKSVAKASRHAKFSFSGGNIVGQGVTDVINAAKDVAVGTLDGLTFGLSNIIPSLFGNAYIDLPKMWDDSSASLAKHSYTMKLISPYGNPISQLQNIYIPLAMILAAALPLSTGKASYTSPFLCKAFLKGIQDVELGMITDLSITRGTSNLAYNKQKKVLAVDVSFTITDLSTLMVSPVDPGIFGAFRAGLDENSVLGKYIRTLASRDLYTNMYAMPKAKIRLSKLKYGADAATSPAYWGARAGDFANTFIGGLVSTKSLNLAERN